MHPHLPPIQTVYQHFIHYIKAQMGKGSVVTLRPAQRHSYKQRWRKQGGQEVRQIRAAGCGEDGWRRGMEWQEAGPDALTHRHSHTQSRVGMFSAHGRQNMLSIQSARASLHFRAGLRQLPLALSASALHYNMERDAQGSKESVGPSGESLQ